MGRRHRDRLQLCFAIHGTPTWADSDSSSFRLDGELLSACRGTGRPANTGQRKLIGSGCCEEVEPQLQPSRSRDNVRRKIWGLRGSAGGWAGAVDRLGMVAP